MKSSQTGYHYSRKTTALDQTRTKERERERERMRMRMRTRNRDKVSDSGTRWNCSLLLQLTCSATWWQQEPAETGSSTSSRSSSHSSVHLSICTSAEPPLKRSWTKQNLLWRDPEPAWTSSEEVLKQPEPPLLFRLRNIWKVMWLYCWWDENRSRLVSYLLVLIWFKIKTSISDIGSSSSPGSRGSIPALFGWHVHMDSSPVHYRLITTFFYDFNCTYKR